jgi:hypothetical protein
METPSSTTMSISSMRRYKTTTMIGPSLLPLVTFELLGLFDLVQNHSADTFTRSLLNGEDEIPILFRWGLNLNMVSPRCTTTKPPQAWSGFSINVDIFHLTEVEIIYLIFVAATQPDRAAAERIHSFYSQMI